VVKDFHEVLLCAVTPVIGSGDGLSVVGMGAYKNVNACQTNKSIFVSSGSEYGWPSIQPEHLALRGSELLCYFVGAL
jgi:hypothetical protein